LELFQAKVIKEDDSSQEKSDADYGTCFPKRTFNWFDRFCINGFLIPVSVERRFTRAAKASRYSGDKRKTKEYGEIEVKSPISSGRRGRPPGSGRRQQQRLFEHSDQGSPPKTSNRSLIKNRNYVLKVEVAKICFRSFQNRWI